MTKKSVPITVFARTTSGPAHTHRVIVPIDLPQVFKPWGPFPGVAEVRDQTGTWDRPGTWTYDFQPLPGRRWIVTGPFKPLWIRYMRAALARMVTVVQDTPGAIMDVESIECRQRGGHGCTPSRWTTR